MSISKVKSEMPMTEFIRWLSFFENEIKRTSKQDFYLAQIAKFVWDFLGYFATWAGDKDFEFKSLDDCLLHFETEEKVADGDKKYKPEPPPMPAPPDLPPGMTTADYIQMKKSESMWGALLGGFQKKGNKPKKKASGVPKVVKHPRGGPGTNIRRRAPKPKKKGDK